MEIIPSLIVSDFEELKSKLDQLEGLVNWAEVDIADGVFSPNITWQIADDLSELDGKIKLSAHLMTELPETIIDDWLEWVDRVVVHIESTNELDAIVEKYASRPTDLAVALELETPIEKVFPYLGKIKTVQLMSILNIGYYGEKFDDRVLEKIKNLRAKDPDLKIVVDGGLDLENAKKVLAAGADDLVVGSHIWRSDDIEEAVRDFQNL